MSRVSLPHDAKAGPTKAEVRAVLLSKLDLRPTDHFVDVGSCTGAVTIEAARRAGRVTALERKPNRLETTRKNLAANGVEDAELREAEAPDGLPVLGECGGLMALAESLTTAEDETYPMAGVLPADIRMHDRYQALDHAELDARGSTLTADAGATLRGHEFHYSSADVASDARFAFDVVRGEGIDGEHDGLTEYRTLATYCHVHPESSAFDSLLDGLG